MAMGRIKASGMTIQYKINLYRRVAISIHLKSPIFEVLLGKSSLTSASSAVGSYGRSIHPHSRVSFNVLN